MNWEDLQLFEACARMRGIAAAAKILRISQPQVSRRLRRFEDMLGARLFDRTPNGLMLTPAGKRLLPIVEEMHNVANKAERIRPELAKDSKRTIRVSLDEVRERFLLEHAKWLKTELPDINLEFYTGHQHLDHASRETDIQIRSCLPETDTLVARKLGELVYYVYVSTDYHAAGGVAPFDDLNWISLGAERLWYPEIAEWMRAHVNGCGVLTVNTQTGVLHSLEAGLGYGILPAFMGDASPLLRRVEMHAPVLVSTENLILHRDLLRDKAVRRTVDAIAELYKRHSRAKLAA